MGMVFPVSTHNYELRYWLAAGGLHPGYYAPHKGDIDGQIDADVLLSVTPPPQMPATLEAGTIYGYCVGEPWNQQAVFKGIGVPVTTDYEIWPNKLTGAGMGPPASCRFLRSSGYEVPKCPIDWPRARRSQFPGWRTASSTSPATA